MEPLPVKIPKLGKTTMSKKVVAVLESRNEKQYIGILIRQSEVYSL